MKKVKSITLSILFTFSLLLTQVEAQEVSIEESITGLYVAYFNRAADQSGLQYWKDRATKAEESDIPLLDVLKELSKGFTKVERFSSVYDKLTNREFVELIYKNALGQEGNEDGIVFWTSKLDEGTSRSDMISLFVQTVLTSELSDSKYDALSSEERAVAQKRKDLFFNRIGVALEYTHKLGSLTNVSNNTLKFTSEYLASINILIKVTDDKSTATDAKAYITTLMGNSGAIGLINNGWNKAPVAQDQTFKIDANNSIEIDLAKLISDPDGVKNITDIKVSSTTSHGKSVYHESNKTISYTPNKSYQGTDIIPYTISDFSGLSDSGEIKIEVGKASVSAGGGGSSSSSSSAKKSVAELGRLAEAIVNIYELNEGDTLCTLPEAKWKKIKTSGEDSNLENIGLFDNHKADLDPNKYYLYRVTGGVDWDVDDDGVKDATGTLNRGTFNLILKGEDIEDSLRITAASEILFRKLGCNTLNKDELDELSKELIQKDLNGDGEIDSKDIGKYNPVEDKKDEGTHLDPDTKEAMEKTLEDIHNDDADTDEDGIMDKDEKTAGCNPNNPDSDGDGVSDSDEMKNADGELDLTIDTDEDGKKNCIDTDDDGDTILTQIETEEGVDTDTDGDEIPDYLDKDDDNDGDDTGSPEDLNVDRDGDGIKDYLEETIASEDKFDLAVRDFVFNADDDLNNVWIAPRLGYGKLTYGIKKSNNTGTNGEDDAQSFDEFEYRGDKGGTDSVIVAENSSNIVSGLVKKDDDVFVVGRNKLIKCGVADTTAIDCSTETDVWNDITAVDKLDAINRDTYRFSGYGRRFRVYNVSIANIEGEDKLLVATTHGVVQYTMGLGIEKIYGQRIAFVSAHISKLNPNEILGLTMGGYLVKLNIKRDIKRWWRKTIKNLPNYRVGGWCFDFEITKDGKKAVVANNNAISVVDLTIPAISSKQKKYQDFFNAKVYTQHINEYVPSGRLEQAGIDGCNRVLGVTLDPTDGDDANIYISCGITRSVGTNAPPTIEAIRKVPMPSETINDLAPHVNNIIAWDMVTKADLTKAYVVTSSEAYSNSRLMSYEIDIDGEFYNETQLLPETDIPVRESTRGIGDIIFVPDSDEAEVFVTANMGIYKVVLETGVATRLDDDGGTRVYDHLYPDRHIGTLNSNVLKLALALGNDDDLLFSRYRYSLGTMPNAGGAAVYNLTPGPTGNTMSNTLLGGRSYIIGIAMDADYNVFTAHSSQGIVKSVKAGTEYIFDSQRTPSEDWLAADPRGRYTHGYVEDIQLAGGDEMQDYLYVTTTRGWLEQRDKGLGFTGAYFYNDIDNEDILVDIYANPANESIKVAGCVQARGVYITGERAIVSCVNKVVTVKYADDALAQPLPLTYDPDAMVTYPPPIAD